MRLNGEKLNSNRLGYLGISFENSDLFVVFSRQFYIKWVYHNRCEQTVFKINSLSEAEKILVEFSQNNIINHAVIKNESIKLTLISNLDDLNYQARLYHQKRYREDHQIGDNLSSLIPLLENITNAILEQKDFSDVALSLKEISEIYQSVADKFKERYEYQKAVNNELYGRDEAPSYS
jgi:DNA anti-recombination protein RmuC